MGRMTHPTHCLPVVDENRHPLGILTIRDILTWAAGALGAR
jgi:CBS domain-containing protein